MLVQVAPLYQQRLPPPTPFDRACKEQPVSTNKNPCFSTVVKQRHHSSARKKGDIKISSKTPPFESIQSNAQLEDGHPKESGDALHISKYFCQEKEISPTPWMASMENNSDQGVSPSNSFDRACQKRIVQSMSYPCVSSVVDKRAYATLRGESKISFLLLLMFLFWSCRIMCLSPPLGHAL